MGHLKQKGDFEHMLKVHTVDSRYLEFQGTLWNTSRYPYFDISDLHNWVKLFEQSHLTNIYVIGLLKLEIYLKNIVEKRRNCSLGAISPLFHYIFYLFLDFYV